MKISSIMPVGVQTLKESSQATAPSFGKKPLSDSEKLAKMLEALGNIGNALAKIGADTQTTVDSLKETSSTDDMQIPMDSTEENNPVPVTQKPVKADSIEGEIISVAPAISKLIKHVKQEYKTGSNIVNDSDTILQRYKKLDRNTIELLGNKFNVMGYTFKAEWNPACVHIKVNSTAEEDNLSTRTIPRNFELSHDIGAYDDNHFTVKSGNRTIYKRSDRDNTFGMMTILPDNIIESCKYLDYTNAFYYKKYDKITNETITSLDFSDNTIKYYDKNNNPKEFKLKVNPDEGSVTCTVKGTDDFNIEFSTGQKVFLDDSIIDTLLGKNIEFKGNFTTQPD